VRRGARAAAAPRAASAGAPWSPPKEVPAGLALASTSNRARKSPHAEAAARKLDNVPLMTIRDTVRRAERQGRRLPRGERSAADEDGNGPAEPITDDSRGRCLRRKSPASTARPCLRCSTRSSGADPSRREARSRSSGAGAVPLMLPAAVGRSVAPALGLPPQGALWAAAAERRREKLEGRCYFSRCEGTLPLALGGRRT